jgi:2-amino-4-hydroxy-6-hydroxymethyldihydropteridine diphosphokinase
VSHVAYIGLGANLGDRRSNILRAVDLLRLEPGVASVELSSLHETRPIGGPPGQGMYLNAAAGVDTTLEADALLRTLLAIEARLGRERSHKWGPRTIDLDILLFDDQVIATPDLRVPHPLMHERRFVLAPLAEIAPGVIHPVRKRSIAEMLGDLADHSPTNNRP